MRRGFEWVTVDEVVLTAGVSSRAVFRYFPAKNDLLLGRMRRIEAVLRPAPEGFLGRRNWRRASGSR